jgi:hypothetical protein
MHRQEDNTVIKLAVRALDVQHLAMIDAGTGDPIDVSQANAWIATGTIGDKTVHCATLFVDPNGKMTGISNRDAAKRGVMISMDSDEFTIAIGTAIQLGVLNPGILAGLIAKA